MKLNFGKKLVLFLHWLLSLVICALCVALCVATDATQDFLRAIDQLAMGWGEAITIALLAVYALLAILSIAFIFSGKKKRGDRSFITVDNNEAGRTRIAIAAVEQMIRQAVRGVDGIVEMKNGIINNDDSISINIAVSISCGAHVPTVTMNIQRAVRSYIELNCGVAVREVSVSVNALENAQEGGKKRGRFAPAPAAVQTYEPAAAEIPAEPIASAVEAVPIGEAPAAEVAPDAEEAAQEAPAEAEASE